MCGNGSSDTEIRKRFAGGGNAWRKVEWVLGNKRTSRKLKGNVLTFCVTPAYIDGLETMTLIENNRKCRFAKSAGYER